MRTMVDKYPIALSYRPATLIIATCAINEEAAHAARVNVIAVLKERVREECDQRDRKAYELAVLRLKQERSHVEKLQVRYGEFSLPACRILVDCCAILLADIEQAIKRAVPLHAERVAQQLAVPIQDLPYELRTASAFQTDDVDLGDID